MSSRVYFILCLLGGGEKSVVGLYMRRGSETRLNNRLWDLLLLVSQVVNITTLDFYGE